MRDQCKPAVGRGPDRRRFMNAAMATGMTAAAASAPWTRTAHAAPSHGGHVIIGTNGGASDAPGHDEISDNRRMDDRRMARRWWFAA